MCRRERPRCVIPQVLCSPAMRGRRTRPPSLTATVIVRSTDLRRDEPLAPENGSHEFRFRSGVELSPLFPSRFKLFLAPRAGAVSWRGVVTPVREWWRGCSGSTGGCPGGALALHVTGGSPGAGPLTCEDGGGSHAVSWPNSCGRFPCKSLDNPEIPVLLMLYGQSWPSLCP